MDQRKPVAPAPALKMSRRAAARSGEGVDAQPVAIRAQAPAVDQMISRELQSIYDEVVNEPIPDRFVQLLKELERKQAGKP